jgi:hypothetical protein
MRAPVNHADLAVALRPARPGSHRVTDEQASA